MKKFTDKEFLEAAEQQLSCNISWNTLRIFRKELQINGVLGTKERLSDLDFPTFFEMISIREKNGLTWPEAADLVAKQKKSTKINTILKIIDDGSMEEKTYDEMCKISEQYHFDISKFLELETAMTDLLSSSDLPTGKDAIDKIHKTTENIFEHAILSEMLAGK